MGNTRIPKKPKLLCIDKSRYNASIRFLLPAAFLREPVCWTNSPMAAAMTQGGLFFLSKLFGDCPDCFLTGGCYPLKISSRLEAWRLL